MTKDDDLWGVIGGIALGAIGLALLSSFTSPKCPECKNPVKRGQSICNNCGAYLEWK